MGQLDEERLEDNLAMLVRRGGLRPPQREALAALELAFQQAGTGLHPDPLEVAAGFEQMAGFNVSDTGLAEGDFALATGVGKSRLAGAVIELLVSAGLSKTFMVLSHRDLLNRRWRSALEPNSPKTVVPLLAGRTDYTVIDSAVDLGGRSADDSVVVIAQTVQTITNSKSLWWQDAMSDLDLREWLRGRNDLVVIFDEAHHLQGDGSGTGWRAALGGLNAKMILGLTATPRGNRHVIYEYSLSQLLVEGKYSKHVDFMVDSVPSSVPEADTDQAALDIGLQLLEAKKAHIRSLPEDHLLKTWSPALLIAASTVNEVEAVKELLISEMGVESERILAIASRTASDSDLEKILHFDDLGNDSADIVIAAFMLDEGWDVTRVSVIVPLRALNSISNAKQIIGRGLRLPAGRRLSDDSLDTLEVVIVGQESLLEIKREVAAAFGPGAVTVTSSQAAGNPRPNSRYVDRDDDRSVLRFPVSLDRIRQVELRLPLIVPCDLERSAPDRWTVETLDMDLTRVAAESGLISVAADVNLRGHLSEVVRRVADRVDFATPQVVVEVLGEWSHTTGREIPEALSVPAVEALTREGLEGSWFSWRDSGRLLAVSPEVVKTTSDVDPDSAIPKDQPWARKRWWTGWNKSTYDLVRFDSNPEYTAAHILDSALNVKWWIRNDPKLLRISLPTQRFAPDFIVQTERALVLLEIKGDHQLDDFLTPALVKTMNNWVSTMQKASGGTVKFETVKGSEVESGMLARLDAY